MKKVFTLFILIAIGYSSIGQFIDFESFGLAPGEFDNDSSPNPWFEDNTFLFPNMYDSEFDFWIGWAISADTDTQTPGFMNQYSSIAGKGAADSDSYAVSFASPSSKIIIPGLTAIDGLTINNNTYTYLSMLNGDAFAKKFGGETGDDPDFLLLTIKIYEEGDVEAVDSVLFYLADYRFEDNSQDYIVDEWTTVTLLSNGSFAQDSLEFILSSSDNGMFGMNTPAYFCVDNITFTIISSTADNSLAGLSLINTLAYNSITIDNELPGNTDYQILNINGQPVGQGKLVTGEQQIATDYLPVGQYWINVRKGKAQWTADFIKK